MFIRLCSAFIMIAALFVAPAAAQNHDKNQGMAKPPAFVTGNLGVVNADSQAALHASAKSALNKVLVNKFGANGTEEMVVTKAQKGASGRTHIRFSQKINGLPVAGAGMVLHAEPDGTVFAINGDFVPATNLSSQPDLNATQALSMVTIEGKQLGKPELSYVLGSDRRGHLAWKVTFEYINEAGPQRDVVFIDTTSGKIAARHPQIKYDRSLDTQNCNQKTRRCRTVSTSSDEISTGDSAIDAAHNYAIATYDYYSTNHQRDSIDNSGMTLISRAHYSRNYNNAFWDGSQMTYGDGDGVTFIPLSQDADVVAHELTHGVTERSSGLIYQNESGALNEAWSDIFGAAVDHATGASTPDTVVGSITPDIWLLGEDIYTPGTPGDALRNMADPADEGDFDYYPTRYTGSSDNGGVHWNSGIANLAFVLLVEGGSHPRGKTTVVVPALDTDFNTSLSMALDIFYEANINCLTPSSNFAAARYCTALFAGNNSTNVHEAWDAVGVPSDLPPAPLEPIVLNDGEVLTNQSGATGEIQQYIINGVEAGQTVTCATSCNNGDADLYLRFGAEAEANPNSTNNECGSYSADSNEACTTDSALSNDTTLYGAVHAFSAYSNLTISCSVNSADNGICLTQGSSCTTGSECCSGSCGGKPGSRTCKK